MTTLPALITIPAHGFEPMKRASEHGLVDDEMCGCHHRIDDESGVFCTFLADHAVHGGVDWTVRVREWTDAEAEAMNR